MIHYTCDVCGEQLPDDYERPKNYHGALQRICKVTDLCPTCLRVGDRIDLAAILMKEWRRYRVPTEAPAAPEPDPDPFRVIVVSDSDTMEPPSLPTIAEEKQEILRRLKAYREAHGPGCLVELAKKTRSRGRISDCVLRDVLTGAAVLSIEDWRRIARGLDAAEAEDKK